MGIKTLKLLIFLIFSSSIVFAEECPNPIHLGFPGNTKFIAPIGGVKCVNKEIHKLSKKEICNCQVKNKNLNLKASPKYKELDQKFGEKQLKKFISQFKTNMTTTIDNAFSVTQFVGGNTTLKSCNIKKLRAIEDKCRKKDSIYSKYFPKKSPFDGFLDQLKAEYDARLMTPRPKNSGGYIVKRVKVL